MSASRSTPRLRLTAVLLLVTLAIVMVSDRDLCKGPAGQLLQLVGLACVTGAALGRIWTSSFIAGHKDARLVREGPYAVLRHPLYAFSMLGMLGIGLATRSLTITAVLLVVFAVIYAGAVAREDRFLAQEHGASFEEYARRVRAFWPNWSAYEVPERLEVRPRIFWKAFLDAGSLIGYLVLLVIADLLQLHGVTPTWFPLP